MAAVFTVSTKATTNHTSLLIVCAQGQMTKTEQRMMEEKSKKMRKNSFRRYRFLEDAHIVEMYKEEEEKEEKNGRIGISGKG